MEPGVSLALITIALAYAFDFANDFHDTANAVATIIHTRAMTSRDAIIMSGILNFLGAVVVGTVVGTAVAMVITEVVPADVVTMKLILAALIGGLMWNLGDVVLRAAGLQFPYPRGKPGRSGAGGELDLRCPVGHPDQDHTLASDLTRTRYRHGSDSYPHDPAARRTWGLRDEVRHRPSQAAAVDDDPLRSGSLFLARLERRAEDDGRDHAGTDSGEHSQSAGVPFWVGVTAAAAIGLGTMIGGWRTIRTVGEKISQVGITPVQGFAAQLSAALIILIGSRVGAPVSTTHVLSSAVAGPTIGEHTRKGLNFKVASNIFLAWIITLPATASMAAVIYLLIEIL